MIISPKKNNQKNILNIIFTKRAISRANVSSILGLSKPAVNEHIDNLINKGIIVEVGEGDSNKKGGRKPILLSPNNAYKYIIAVDMNYTKPLIALGSINGFILDRLRIDNYHDIIDAQKIIKNAIEGLMSRNSITLQNIAVIVISMPGIIDQQKGLVIYNPQHEQLHSLGVISYLREIFNIPIIFKNDVNMAAIGEEIVLEDDQKNNIIFISCGKGLGAGIIINGNLYEGENNAAGEIGYFLDYEGNILEESISLFTLLQKVNTLKITDSESVLFDKENIEFEDIINAYNNNEKIIVDLIEVIGRKLGISIINIVSILDINVIVFGGDYIVFKEVIIREIEKVIQSSKIINKPIVIPSKLEYASGIIGCLKIGVNYIIDNLDE